MKLKKLTALELSMALTGYLDAEELKQARVDGDKAGVYNSKGGEFRVFEAYFYRFNRTPEKLAERTKATLEAAGYSVEITGTDDNFASWPRTSYMSATFRAERGTK